MCVCRETSEIPTLDIQQLSFVRLRGSQWFFVVPEDPPDPCASLLQPAQLSLTLELLYPIDRPLKAISLPLPNIHVTAPSSLKGSEVAPSLLLL